MGPGAQGRESRAAGTWQRNGLSQALEKSQEWSPLAPLQLMAEGACWFKAVLATHVVWRGQAMCWADLRSGYNQIMLMSP